MDTQEQDDTLDTGVPEAAMDDTAAESEFVVEEKKRGRGSLFIFGLILAGVGATYLMMMRSGPSTAAAAAPETVAAQKTISQFLKSGNQNVALMEKMLRDTEKVVQQFLSYPSMTQIPLSDLRTNPFRHNPEKPATVADSETAARKKREEERQAALQAVQGLELQSIMHSESRRACMINNALFQEGQTVEGFTVEKITAAAVIVKSGPFRFELRMKK
jgi:hypothetical protein